jgi:hypothetical protein
LKRTRSLQKEWEEEEEEEEESENENGTQQMKCENPCPLDLIRLDSS